MRGWCLPVITACWKGFSLLRCKLFAFLHQIWYSHTIVHGYVSVPPNYQSRLVIIFCDVCGSYFYVKDGYNRENLANKFKSIIWQLDAKER